MKTTAAGLLCAAIALVLVSACAQKVNAPADVQAIKDLQGAFDKAWNAGDADGVLSAFYTADAIRMEPNQPATAGRDAMRASMGAYFDQFSDNDTDVADDVRVCGDLAVARGSFVGTSTLKAGGYSANLKGKWLTAFQRQADGTWKAFWDIINSDLPVADALPAGAEEQAVMQIEREWAAVSAKNDLAGLDKILATEYANNTDGRITPKKELLAKVKGGATKTASAEAGEMKVLVLGDTAIAHGLWMEKSTIDGKDTSGTYRYTDTFIKRDGRWQAVTTYSTKVQ